MKYTNEYLDGAFRDEGRGAVLADGPAEVEAEVVVGRLLSVADDFEDVSLKINDYFIKNKRLSIQIV